MSDQSNCLESGEDEVARNFDIYLEKYKNQLIETDEGRFAVMHHGKVITILDGRDEASSLGVKKYGKGRYSIVEIRKEPYMFATVTIPDYEQHKFIKPIKVS